MQSLERFGGQFRPFMAARARRLLPVYFLVLALSMVLLTGGQPAARRCPGSGQPAAAIWPVGLPPGFGWHFLAHVLLVQGVLPQGVLPYAYVTLLGPAWSLSTEWQFYLLIGLIAPRRLGAFALALLAMGVAYHALNLPPWWQFSRAFLPDAAPYFALGIASALLLRGGGVKIFILCLLGACAVEFSGGAEKALVPLAWALAMLAQRQDWGAVLEGRAVKYLGAISYPLYLVNEPCSAPWLCFWPRGAWRRGDLHRLMAALGGAGCPSLRRRRCITAWNCVSCAKHRKFFPPSLPSRCGNAKISFSAE